MGDVGIICEYNPFHAGHAYLLRRAREAGGRVICLMSGNFTQRGEAAILPPVPRAAMATAAGADLVLELPFPQAAGSARRFAEAGTAALAALGVETIACGSECADAALLQRAAERACEAENAGWGGKTAGDAARHFGALGLSPASNDILAIEYMRAALAGGLRLSVLPVRRVGSGHRETDPVPGFPSAAALRARLAAGEDIGGRLLPETREIFAGACAAWGVADTARLGAPLLALLRRAEAAGGVPADCPDCGGGLGERLLRASLRAVDYASLCAGAGTKTFTAGRVRRALLYLLAGVRESDFATPPVYLRLLAADRAGLDFLAETRRTRRVAVVTKPADAARLGAAASRERALARLSDGMYALCLPGRVAPARLQTVPPYLAADVASATDV